MCVLSVVAVVFVAVAAGSTVVMAGCGVEVFIVITFRVVNEVFKVDLFPLVKDGVGNFGLLVIMGVFVFFELNRVLVLLGFDEVGTVPGE